MSVARLSTEPAHRDDEIRSARTFPVARAALFAAFVDPVVLAEWWGPQGSVNIFEAFDIRPGGEWRFVMQTADGIAYPMHNRFLEVVAPERIVLEHVQADHQFQIHIVFEAPDAGHTRMDWRMLFQSPAEAVRVRDFVLEANEQNFDRLEAVLGLPASRCGTAVAPAV